MNNKVSDLASMNPGQTDCTRLWVPALVCIKTSSGGRRNLVGKDRQSPWVDCRNSLTMGVVEEGVVIEPPLK
jgi:hypothetical protein